MFQYFSDLHTEEYKSHPNKLFRKLKNNIKPYAPYLIIAGDIGDPYSKIYSDTLQYLSHLFIHVFIIAGNHEYYGSHTMSAVQEQCRSVSSTFPNVTFLENNIFHVQEYDISIFGATFWSHINPEEETNIISKIADYKFIPEFTPETSRRLHEISLNKLKEALNTYPSKQFIIISHHLPSLSLCLCI